MKIKPATGIVVELDAGDLARIRRVRQNLRNVASAIESGEVTNDEDVVRLLNEAWGLLLDIAGDR